MLAGADDVPALGDALAGAALHDLVGAAQAAALAQARPGDALVLSKPLGTGLALAAGDVWASAQAVARDGDPIGTRGAGPPTFGPTWRASKLNPWTLVAGDPPRGDDQVVFDKGTADDGGFGVGDQSTVLVQGAPIEVTVSGIARIGGADSPGGASFTMFTTEAAQ